MKKILIIAGPNGAGKTTFAEEFLPQEAACLEFVNADLIAAGLSPFQPEQLAFTAGRLMLSRIQELATAGTSFAFETTLSTRSWQRQIPRWKADGFRVELHFLRLPNPEFAIERVELRVSQGGHHIPEEIIRRRFARGLANLEEIYRPLVDEWFIYDGSRQPPQLVETHPNLHPGKLMEDPPSYPAGDAEEKRPQPPTDPAHSPKVLGALAALARASEKAVARARAAGLEPVVWTDDDEKED